MGHRGAFQRTVEQFERQMDGGRARQAVPIPTFRHKAASGTGNRISLSHYLHRAVALITSVTVVFGINLGSPHISRVSFQRHHPVSTAEDACRTVVVDEEPLRGLRQLDAFFLEETRIGGILVAHQPQIVGRQTVIERIAPTGQVAAQSYIGKCLYVIIPHLPTERMATANADSPFIKIAIVAHGYECGFYMLTGLFSQFEPCIVGKSDELSYHRQHSGGVCRIETTVMESGAVHLDSSERSR